MVALNSFMNVCFIRLKLLLELNFLRFDFLIDTLRFVLPSDILREEFALFWGLRAFRWTCL